MRLSRARSQVQTFICDDFEGDSFLRAQLTIDCDGSVRRRRWVAFSCVGLAVYPVGVPLMLFSLMYTRRENIVRIMELVKESDEQFIKQTSFRSIGHLSSRQTRPSVINMASDLAWCAFTFETYQPHCWFMGPVLLVLRLAQTSLLAFARSPNIQACFACAITLGGIVLLFQLAPFRRSSDNDIATLAQGKNHSDQTYCTHSFHANNSC
jgi:hypothetical protein